MKVLVTGSAGFVGSHVCDRLIADGHHVEGWDDLRHGVDFDPTGTQAWRRSLEGGLPDAAEPYDAVVHCAARADVADNWSSHDARTELYESNVFGTMQVCEVARRWKAPVIFLSTCAVYGDSETCDRAAYQVATSPYAASKLAGEALVQAYAHEAKTPWHVLRLSCVVGSRYHHGHVADFVRMGLAGSIKARSNGLGVKSFVHVLDVADAVATCVTGFPSGVYNLAGGMWSPNQTVEVMRSVRPVEVQWAPAVHGWVGDPMAKAYGTRVAILGPDRQWRDVESGVREALESLGWKAGAQ